MNQNTYVGRVSAFSASLFTFNLGAKARLDRQEVEVEEETELGRNSGGVITVQSPGVGSVQRRPTRGAGIGRFMRLLLKAKE